MPYTLILMRHAKSAWDDPEQDDFERPLNRRGRMAAPLVAEWLVAKGHLPDTVIVSGARRTLETWEHMATAMPETATMESNPALYLASPDTMLNVLKSQTALSLMMITHNPGIAAFAARIVDAAPQHSGFTTYPTAATLVAEFDIDSWAEVEWSKGRAREFVVPKDLTCQDANPVKRPLAS